MKKLLNIIKLKRNRNTLTIDEIVEKNSISYQDINFNPIEINTIEAYEKLNHEIKINNSKNFSLILSSYNWKPILKPIYTIVLTSIVLLTIIYLRKETDDDNFAEIIVEKGEKIKLNVNKNLTIWINSESSVRIPTNGKIGKEIYLDGEAYIEINKENKKTYSVISGNSICYIKNGAFNLKTDDNQIVATVSKGTVDFYNINLPKSTQITIAENEKATLFKKHDFIAVETEKNTNYLFWKTGILQFNNSDMQDVAKTLTRYFQIPVQIENIELQNEHFSATFTNPEIDDILDKIQSTTNCQIAGDGSKLIIY